MRALTRKITATIACTALAISGMGDAFSAIASAQPAYIDTTSSSDDQTQEIAKAARLLQRLNNAETPEQRKAIAIEELGEEDATNAAAAVGLTLDELFSDETVPNANGERDFGEFLTCMKGKAEDDINAIAAYIGKEKYWEAAAEAVKYLAKQGVKRNVAGLAGLLAWYAAKCSFLK